MEFRPRLIKKGEPSNPVQVKKAIPARPTPIPRPLPSPAAEAPQPTPQPTPAPSKPDAELVKKLKALFKGHLKSGKKFDAEMKRRAMKRYGVTSRELKKAIRHLAGHPPDREVCFQIEKGFFGRAESWPGGFSELAALTARELEVREAVCYTWLTWLARLKGSFRNQVVADESAEKILARYREYLRGEAPPAEPVHAWIARQLEETLTPEQVGFVVITHRRQILTEFKRRVASTSTTGDPN